MNVESMTLQLRGWEAGMPCGDSCPGMRAVPRQLCCTHPCPPPQRLPIHQLPTHPPTHLWRHVLHSAHRRDSRLLAHAHRQAKVALHGGGRGRWQGQCGSQQPLLHLERSCAGSWLASAGCQRRLQLCSMHTHPPATGARQAFARSQLLPLPCPTAHHHSPASPCRRPL